MSGIELLILGTAGQVPTRTRNHNGYYLRWGAEGLLFDPGEGTQRQFTLAGASPGHLSRICLTHLHGDHCLGLPGVLERHASDGHRTRLPIHFPASGRPFVERLCEASIGSRHEVALEPIESDGTLAEAPPLTVQAHALDHSVDAYGYRVSEPGRRHLLAGALATRGLRGPAVGELVARGWVQGPSGRVTIEEVSEWRSGRSVAVVLDTRPCDGALAAARDVDLLLCEATFLESEADLAARYGHMTARQAAELARDAGAARLVLTHLSARYPDPSGHLEEAAAVFDQVTVAEDLTVVELPPRS